jgi:hypothetical protein
VPGHHLLEEASKEVVIGLLFELQASTVLNVLHELLRRASA